MIKNYVFLLGFLLLLGACSVNEPGVGDIVQLESGKVSGVQDTLSGVISFKGIPFAAPPVGELRWKAPQPVEPWEGIRECSSFGPSPMQASPAPFMFWSEEFLIPAEPISEDCLYLNVWTHAEAPSDKLPVLVYIYGGGFRSGGSACAIYDGQAMAEKGVIFVSINYRVGVFGFLAHPGLSAEAPNRTSGNYALLDMIAALEWVQKNIAAFGGDPERVTIAGQSAGAFGVNYLTVSPLASGLFHRAIAQSGAGFLSSPFRPRMDLKGAEKNGLEFGERLNAPTLVELRALPADSIQQVQGGLSGPIPDGYVLPENIMDAYLNNHQNDVPVMIGWNKDDRVMPFASPAAQFREQIRDRFGELADDFFAVYPADTEEAATQSQFEMSRDETFGIQMYTWAKVQHEIGGSEVYMYNFNRDLPAYSEETQFGAFHSGEIVYAYNNLHTLDRPWEMVDQQIAGQMSDYWTNFVKTGDPNGPGLPRWDPYDIQNQHVLILDTIIGQQNLPDKEKFAFWENYFASLSAAD